MKMYTALDMLVNAFKARPGMAMAAILTYLGILSLAVKRGKLMHSFENRKRLNVAFENHGLR